MKIQLDRFRNGEYIQFLKDVLVLSKEHSLVRQDLRTNIEKLSNQVEKLERVFKVRGHVLTSKIREADVKRDQVFIGLKNVVKGNLNHFDDVRVEHANQVMHLISRYGVNVTNLNYQAETENLDVLIKALGVLETEQGILTNLGIMNWVEELMVLNDSFNELYILRTTSKAETGVQSVRLFRKETDGMYHQLIALLDAIILTKNAKNKPVDLYVQTKQNLDELSKQYIDMVLLRKSRTQEESSDEEDTSSDGDKL